MPLADSNVWLALALSAHPFHSAARTWLAPQGPAEALFCRSTQQSFLRLLSTKAILDRYGLPPLSNEAAWSVYEGFRADSRVGWTDEPANIDPVWKRFADSSSASPKLWMDAYLAAFAVAAALQFVTTDTGFRQFDGLNLLVLS
jgi:toxin-antitoxin system PIN domain toxin